MIRFILLLPIKIIGLLFMAIGAILDGANRCRIEQAKQDERRRREQYRIEQAAQAATDIEHYKIQRAELIKLYNEIEKQYNETTAQGKKEILFRKQLALNNQIRGVDRQIEKAQYTINRTG